MEKIYQKFIDKVKKKKKGYLHFDPRINYEYGLQKHKGLLLSPFFKKRIKNAKHEQKLGIEKHHRYPFINYVKVTPRYKRDKNGNVIPNKKERPICYAAHKDALIYTRYNFLLVQKYEALLAQEKNQQLNQAVVAYRDQESIHKNKSNIHHAFEVFKLLKNRQKSVTLALDIKGFFDNLDHQILVKQCQKLL